MKIWLDDMRPAPDGWIHVKTVPELKELIRQRGDDVTDLSLDHDLGDGEQTGYEFLVWFEVAIATGDLINVPTIRVHSANPVGRERMFVAIESIKRLVCNA